MSKMTSWVDPRVQSKETASSIPDFTEQPSLLRGYSIHTRLSKGPRGFGFNIVGGSRPQEFLQVYSVTPGGPPALNTADILVYINDTCVLGRSHKDVVEMLKSVPMGQSVDVVLRRGYPMLYNPDGCPKQSLEQAQTPTEDSDANRGPTHLTYSRTLDANGSKAGAAHNPASFAPLMTNGWTEPITPISSEPTPCPPPLPERTPPNHSDSEGGPSNAGTRRSSLISYNSSTLPALPSSSRLLHQSSKSSDSDLSTSTLPITSSSSQILSKLPLNQPETSAAQNSTNSTTSNNYLSSSTPPVQCQPMPMTFPVPNSPKDIPPCGFNGCPASHQAASLTSHGNKGLISPLVRGSTSPGLVGELVPVVVGRSESGGLGFSVTTGGQEGQQVVVKRVWDRRQCLSLQAGDIIVKINGADVQSLSFVQVQRVLQEHTKQGEVVLLVYRGGPLSCPVVTPNLYKSQSSSHILTTPSSSNGPHSPELPFPSTGALLGSIPPLSLAGLAPEGQQKGYHPAAGNHQGAPPAHSPKGPPPSSLIQSTSFLDSVPVTLTLEPCDLLKGEGIAGGRPPIRGGAAVGAKDGNEGAKSKPVEVELHRRQGEGFGFVISSQEMSKGPSLMSHRFVTVRRGSPAARCGQIQPGDQLEEVEGRPVSGLHHRDLAQILRRAGNTLRLSITPQHRGASSSEGVELDIDGGLIQGSNQRSKHKSRFYGVDLERGPTGFGFSLRGGSEYNMGLYVLGLMDGGPAQRSNKIKVSDQLVEINSESTAGMTHSQAVEQIRRGGQRIRLVLKKGNGYVPDYDPEIGAFSLPSFSSPNKEQRVVSMTTTSLSQRQRGGGERGETKREMEANRRTRRRAELGAPALDLDHVEQEMMRKEDEAEKKRHQEERRAMMEQEQRKNVRLNKQEERSFHRHRVPSLGSKQMVETLRSGARERGSGKARSRRRRDEDENSTVSHHSSSHHAKYSGSLGGTQRAVFSFLMPMKDLSDSESACSFSEVSLSTASTVTWRRQNYDQRRDESPMCQENMPGRWLKLNAQKLT